MDKDLHLVLDAIVRQAKHRHRNTGHVDPFATILTSQGKIAQLATPARVGVSAQETIRILENGVYTRVRQGMCRAVGICFFDVCPKPGAEAAVEGIHVVLEHEDGSAYQILLPYREDGMKHFVYRDSMSIRSNPKFFLNPR